MRPSPRSRRRASAIPGSCAPGSSPRRSSAGVGGTVRKGYRYAEAAHQARVARVLGGDDVGDATPAEREAASRDAERALGDAALARLDAKDVEGARVRLERARAARGLNTAAIGELLALVGEAKQLR